ncbi:SEC-C domain-containing protein [Treponema sp. OttesenSCG-928-L16]|nr:SEC-C domain-containing protein [Treponema sp. OttesenSCG-928-L16]
MRHLSKHRPYEAVREFKRAVDACPVREKNDLARILYFNGLALERIGQKSLAVKSWINARRLVRRKFYKQTLARWINDYGMRKRNTREADDYYAFKAIQIARYLQNRGISVFSSCEEKEVVLILINEAWAKLAGAKILRPMSNKGKTDIFKRTRIDFPYLHPEDAFRQEAKIIPVSFRNGPHSARRIKAGGPCFCGSGLKYEICCGRVKTPEEMFLR